MRHTKTIEIISVWKRTEAGAGAIKKRELRNWSHTHETKSSGAGAGAMFMERRALELELCHFYDVSTALNFTWSNAQTVMYKQLEVIIYFCQHVAPLTQRVDYSTLIFVYHCAFTFFCLAVTSVSFSFPMWS